MFDPKRPLALIDMDETSFDFRTQANTMLAEMGIISEPIPDSQSPKLEDDLKELLGNAVVAREIRKELFNRENFWETMPMKPGAHAGILMVREAGVQVRFCSMPPKDSPYSSIGKRISIRSNFEGKLGAQLASEAFIDRDKTFAEGTLLLDDLAEIRGRIEPVFEHIVYTRESNKGVEAKYRMNDWSEGEVVSLIDTAYRLHNR